MANDDALMALARKRAQDKIGFYIHFAVYIAVNALLIGIWWFVGDGFPWFLFILGFWGIGIVAHFMGVFVGTGMTDRMTQREYEKLRRGKE